MLEALLIEPSVEHWLQIVRLGVQAHKDAKLWENFESSVRLLIHKWPPEVERLCPKRWPKEFRDAVENRPWETDTYGHYLAKICTHPELRLSDGSQAVWLERRFTGGVVQVSTVQQALRMLAQSSRAASAAAQQRLVDQATNLLANGVRNVGKVGCADLTGGVVVEKACRLCAGCKSYGAVSLQCDRVLKFEARLEIEVKVGDEEQRPEQVARMRSVRARGGCYVLCRSVDEAVAQIKAFIAERQ